MIKQSILLTVACLSFAFVDANESNRDKARLLITSYFEKPKTLQANFIQHILDENNRIVESMNGKFYVDKPQKVRWEYLEPYEQIFLADGINFISYDIDLNQVIIKSQKQIFNQSQVVLFLNDDELLEYYKIEKISQEADIFWITLKSVEDNQPNNQFLLGFSEGLLVQILLVDTIGQTININIKDIKINEPIPASLFNLEIPNGTDVIGQSKPVN